MRACRHCGQIAPDPAAEPICPGSDGLVGSHSYVDVDAICCDQQCGHVATVHAIDPHPGGWGGRYCEPCARALKFQVIDRLTVFELESHHPSQPA